MSPRSLLALLILTSPLGCSSQSDSSSDSTPPTKEPTIEDKYADSTTITGPRVALGSGETAGACSVRDVQIGLDISGALKVNADTSDYGCSGTRSAEGDQMSPSVNAMLADGRALDITLNIDDTDLDQTDAPTRVTVWARERPLTFGAYSETWAGEECATTYQVEDLDVSSASRKTYRVQGSTTCTGALAGANIGAEPTDPTATLDRFDFVGVAVWFDRSSL